MYKTFILIPARYESSRFPGKPLAKINGKEMIIRVIERATYKHEVITIVNNDKIADLIREKGYKYILIKDECKTGTDRITLALKKLNCDDKDIIINVQGDEPMISPWMIDKVIDIKKKYPNHVVNAFSKINSYDDLQSKSTIKVVVNKNHELLYASRSELPSEKGKLNLKQANKQVCIYGFNRKQLEKFIRSERGPLEKSEDIEILRFVENSLSPVKMVDLGTIQLHAVDYPSDIKKVESILNKGE